MPAVVPRSPCPSLQKAFPSQAVQCSGLEAPWTSQQHPEHPRFPGFPGFVLPFLANEGSGHFQWLPLSPGARRVVEQLYGTIQAHISQLLN